MPGAALENHQSRQTSSTGPSPAMEGPCIRVNFLRAYRAVHSARSGLISDVPSLLWLARCYHLYYPRSLWPDIHAALLRLTGTPGLEGLQAALAPMDTRRRRGQKGHSLPLSFLSGLSSHAAATPMPPSMAADADVCHSGQTPTSPTAVPAALPLQLAWTSDRTPLCTPNEAGLQCLDPHLPGPLWPTLQAGLPPGDPYAHNTEHVQQPGVQRGGYHHPRPDLSLFRSVCTTGHRDGLKSTRKSRKPPASSAVASREATIPYPQHRQTITSLNAQASHPWKQDICHLRPCSMHGRQPLSVKTPPTGRTHRVLPTRQWPSCPRRPVPYADCTTSSSPVLLPCGVLFGKSPSRAGLETWTPWTDPGPHPRKDRSGSRWRDYHLTPPRTGLDLGRRTRPRPWVRRLPSRGAARRKAHGRGKRGVELPAAPPSNLTAACCRKAFFLSLSAAAFMLSVTAELFLQPFRPNPHSSDPQAPSRIPTTRLKQARIDHPPRHTGAPPVPSPEATPKGSSTPYCAGQSCALPCLALMLPTVFCATPSGFCGIIMLKYDINSSRCL